ncbi:SPOR domain-containing protein [Candidatus Cardinium hertigii]|uniref:SPOR domain-containing protein n=1 Tax=Candidatus Cardinium hertigii TaxID=247481 RepID=A0A2Z3LE42_9BACT|nr:SPOR domain-containing protein [Candidatus Cardinium hertigii]AWN82302.1 hypothetical protein DK880_01005 [Candidatus Cardinium hertigii]
MATEPVNDHKFGLPEPDFHTLSIKRSNKKPLSLVIAFLSIVGISILLYRAYFVMWFPIKPTEAPIAQPTPVTENKESAHSVSAFPAEEMTTKDSCNALEVNETVSGDEAFKPSNPIKKKESITAVQKQLEAKKQPKPFVKPGSYEVLRIPQGIYHLVVVSYLDKKLATQAIQQLTKKNLGVCLILPNSTQKYYRVTIGHSRTEYEAEQKLKEFKPLYKNIFIMKY